jgi:hypothetical protein
MSSRCTRFQPADADLHRIKRRALGLHRKGDGLNGRPSELPFAPGYRRAHHRRRDASAIAIMLKVSSGTADGQCGSRSTLRDEAIAETLIFRAQNALSNGARNGRCRLRACRKQQEINRIRCDGEFEKWSASTIGKRRWQAPARNGSTLLAQRKRAMRRRLATAAAAEQIRDPSPDFGCERSPKRLIGSPGVTKWLSSSAALNLPLAARPRVGHIGLTGDVAEWLKAAVC